MNEGISMREHRFDERIAHLHISYEPDGVPARDFGPIRVALPGSAVNMTAEQAEIAAGFLMGVAAIAKRHAENRLVCPPDCPECGCVMRSLWYQWACPNCDRRIRRK